jgi:SAM-dependent methyltransferase
MDASLYDRPDLYDLMSPVDPEMEGFYVSQALQRGGRVLELACGTGRFTIPLARAGLQVVAGDLSDTMLNTARAAANAAGVEVDFRQLDMRDFDLGTRFDTIMVAANSVLHLHRIEEFRAFFGSVERHLAPDGRLVFDAFVPSLSMLTRAGGQRHPVGSFGTDPDAASVEETIDYDPITQVSRVEWFWSRPGEPDFWRHRLDMRQIFPQEMPVLVAFGGLRLLERFGGFDRSPLTARSHRQLYICGR